MACINVGMIGLGHMGRLHMMNCSHIENVKVIASADTSKSALRKAKSLGIKSLYHDYHRMTTDRNLNLDAVIISLPNFLHFDSIRSGLEAGLHVFVEKPMATSVDECRQIVKLERETGLRFMTGHNLRFYAPVEKMKEAVDKGFIGDLEAITLEELTNGPFEHPAVPRLVPEWWFDPRKTKGGALIDIGSHLIDLFHSFVGDSELLFSRLDYEFNLPVEDSAILVMKSSNSLTRGIVHAGWYQKAVFPNLNFRMILHGNCGYLSTEDLEVNNIYLHAATEGIKNLFRKLFGKKIRPLSYSQYFESYYKELKYFFDSIKQETDCSKGSSAIDGLRTSEIIEESYEN